VAKRAVPVPEQCPAITAVYPRCSLAMTAARRPIVDVEAGGEDWQAIKRERDWL
jgi:hypothetical protein